MTTHPQSDQATVAFSIPVLHSVLALAGRAPSIHNTQPWRWELGSDGLSLFADRSRQLTVADPDGHSLRISCGAALALTEIGFRAAGWSVRTLRFPDDSRPELLATFTDPEPYRTTDADHALAEAAANRISDRRPFDTEPVDESSIEALRVAAATPAVRADFPVRTEQRVNLAVVVSSADRAERQDPAYLTEMNRWLRDADVIVGAGADPHADGIPMSAVPHVEPGHPRHTDLPQRDFEVGVSGHALIERDVDERPLIAVLLSKSDSPAEQVSAGESMMGLMLRAEQLGLASCPLSQAVDYLAFRSRLQTLMGWQGFPQMMLRIGHPVGSEPRPAATPRRPVAEVLVNRF